MKKPKINKSQDYKHKILRAVKSMLRTAIELRKIVNNMNYTHNNLGSTDRQIELLEAINA